MCMTVYHNNRWSKSRAVVQLLRDNNVEFTIIEYLKEPININTISKICKILAVEGASIVRVNDKNFKALKVELDKLNNNEILELIAENPIILERPIIIKNTSGVIGRPPENVKKLF